MEPFQPITSTMQQIRVINEFRKVCECNRVFPNEKQMDQLRMYHDLLLKWNKRINLVSRKDEVNLWIKHILQCVSLLFKVSIKLNSRVVDIGTGGGLPGIPIKILRPDLTMLLIDATRKKTEALLEILKNIEINNIRIEWGRAEEIGLMPQFHKKYDLVFARAVAPISKLSCWSKLFLVDKKKGDTKKNEESKDKIFIESPALIAYKGGDLTKELNINRRQLKNISIKTIKLSIDYDNKDFCSDPDKKVVIVNF